MTLYGTVVNGLIVLDGPEKFAEGSRVEVRLGGHIDDIDDELADELAGMPIPPPSETYEEHLALLRKSIADAKAGERGLPVREAMARIAAELNLPVVDED
jgi:hypothetical protein